MLMVRKNKFDANLNFIPFIYRYLTIIGSHNFTTVFRTCSLCCHFAKVNMSNLWTQFPHTGFTIFMMTEDRYFEEFCNRKKWFLYSWFKKQKRVVSMEEEKCTERIMEVIEEDIYILFPSFVIYFSPFQLLHSELFQKLICFLWKFCST